MLAASTLMTPTMEGLRILLRILEDKKIRDKYAIMFAGSALTEDWAKSEGADVYVGKLLKVQY